MPKVLTPEQQKAYFASESNKPNPLSPLDWLKRQESGLPSLPQGGGASLPGQTPELPETKTTGNSLLDFKNAIAAIDKMAKENRNQFATSLAGAVPEGTLNASSFGDIVQMLNRGGNDYASQTAANALDAYETTLPKAPDIFTATDDNGNVHGIDKATGAIVWTAPGVGNRQGSGGGGGETSTKSGALVYTAQDKSEDSQALENSRGADGYVDPTIYLNLYKAWIAAGGSVTDFVKEYPPKNYVNPANTWLPSFLKSSANSDDLFNSL